MAQPSLNTLFQPPPTAEEGAREPVSEEPADTIQTDRPGFSTGTHTVAPGVVQVEAGYRHLRANDGDAETDILPEINARVGMRPDLEINVAMDALVERRANGRSRDGTGDVALGIKAGPWQPRPSPAGPEGTRTGQAKGAAGEDRAGPEGEAPQQPSAASIGRFGFLGRVILPTGSAPGTDDGTGLSAALLWERDLNAYANLFGVLQGEFEDAFGDNDTTLSAAYGMRTMLSGPLSGFLEYYVTVPEQGTAVHTLDTGITYLLTRNTQVDLHFGAGLFGRGEDFVGVGLAQRF
jgi:hypothetical protein